MGSASTVCDGLSWIHCWQPLGTTHPNAFFCHMFTFHPEIIEVGQLKILCHLTEKYRVSSQGPNTTAGTGKIKVQVNKNNTQSAQSVWSAFRHDRLARGVLSFPLNLQLFSLFSFQY